MIAIERSKTFPGIVVCLQGTQTTAEFDELANAVSFQGRPDARSCVLLDWSRLKRWEFSASTSMSVESWIESAHSIERAAIVHHHCWNRQAAWIGAVLRLGNAQVRSYRIEDREKAQAWLKSAS